MSATPGLFGRFNVRKNVKFALAEFVFSTALLFFSYRLIILHSGVDAIGVWATLNAWTNLIRLGDVGITAATTRYLALWDVDTHSKEARVYAETAILTNLVQFAFLSLGAYWALSLSMERVVGHSHTAAALRVLPWLLLSFMCSNISGTVLGALQGLHLGYRRSQLMMFGTVVQLVAVIVLVPSHGLVGLAFAQVLQHGLTLLVGWWLVARTLKTNMFPRRFDIGAFREMLGYSVRVQLVSVANGLLEPVSKVLVGHFGGMHAQGLFELAYKTILVPRNLLGAGVTAIAPTMTALDSRGGSLKELYARVWRFSVLAMALSATAVSLLAPAPSLLLLGRIDATYWEYVVTLAVGFSANAIGIPAYMFGMAAGRFRENVLSTLLALLTLTTFGLVLGSVFGARGVVISTALAIGTVGVVVWILRRAQFTDKAVGTAD